MCVVVTSVSVSLSIYVADKLSFQLSYQKLKSEMPFGVIISAGLKVGEIESDAFNSLTVRIKPRELPIPAFPSPIAPKLHRLSTLLISFPRIPQL